MSPGPGWFPDPDGTHGRSRFWDGSHWTAQTAQTASIASTRADEHHGPRSRHRGRTTVAIVLLALAVLTLGVVVLVRTSGRGSTEITEPPPAPTISAGDDGASPSSSPSPTATAPSTTSPTAVRPDPSGSRPERCDERVPDQLPAPATDGRIHGGPLSFPAADLPGWSGPISETRIPYGRDTAQLYLVDRNETRGWQSSATVGVTAFPDYPGSKDAANTILQCVVTSSLYLSMTVEISSTSAKSITVDGVAATRVDAVIDFDDPSLKTKGSRLWIIVVDTEPATFAFAAIPEETTAQVPLVEKVITDLTVD